MTKKWYNVKVAWELYGSYDIEAESEEEARRIANELPLPHNGEYVDDSFEIDHVEELDMPPYDESTVFADWSEQSDQSDW